MKTLFTLTTMQRSFRVLALAVMLTCGLYAGTQPVHAATTIITDWVLESPYPQAGALQNVFCPTATFCKAVGGNGVILSWDGAIWSADISGTTTTLFGVSCATLTQCKVVGNGGTILSWNGAIWSADSSGTANNLFGISCPTTTFCKAGGNSGTVIGWDGTSWTTESLGTSNSLTAISCPTTMLCKAATWTGATSRILSWGGSSWVADSNSYNRPGFTAGVFCPTTTLCHAVQPDSRIFTWNGTIWSSLFVYDIPSYDRIACPTTTLCKAVGYASSEKIRSWNGASWSVETYGTNSDNLNDVACPSTTLCEAVGDIGAIVSWNGTAWSEETSGTTNHLYGVACPSALLCKAVGSDGTILAWNGSVWSADSSGTGSTLSGISCSTTTTLCKAVGAGGTILSWNGSLWSADTSPTTTALNGISCPTATYCKAVGDSGVLVSWNGSVWSADTSGTTNGLKGVSCATTTFCKAVGVSGTILSWNGSSWSAEVSPTIVDLRGVACPSTTLCKVVGDRAVILGMVTQTRNDVSAGFALDVFNSTSCLNGVTITEYQTNHPNATASLQNGRYWTITPVGCTSGFSATLTLPTTFTPNSSSVVCRYLGSGTSWNCANNGFTTSPNTLTRVGVTQFSDWAAGTSAPTSATLTKFNTKYASKKNVVRVKWETGSEVNVVGFTVWRRIGNTKAAKDTKTAKGWVQLNEELIAAQHPGEVVGGRYKYADKKVKQGKNYFYKLEIVRADGTSEWSEEEKVSVP